MHRRGGESFLYTSNQKRQMQYLYSCWLGIQEHADLQNSKVRVNGEAMEIKLIWHWVQNRPGEGQRGGRNYSLAVYVEGEFNSTGAKLLSRKTKNQKHHIRKKEKKRTHSVNLNSIKLNNNLFYFGAKVNHWIKLTTVPQGISCTLFSTA